MSGLTTPGDDPSLQRPRVVIAVLGRRPHVEARAGLGAEAQPGGTVEHKRIGPANYNLPGTTLSKV